MPALARVRPIALRWALGVLGTLLVLWIGLFALRAAFPLTYRTEIAYYSTVYDLEPALVASLIRNESRFHPDAVSTAGAIGLMQIMPESGAWIAEQLSLAAYDPERLTDPSFNISLGTWYLRYLLDRYGSVEAALWAYNAGPTRANAWLTQDDPPFPETAAYADRIQHQLPIYRFALRFAWLYASVPALPI